MINEFNYTDAKGKKSHRVVYVTSKPTDKLSGIDLSELSQVDQARYSLAHDALLQEYLDNVAALQAAMDVKHKYRQFFPNKMESVIEEA